VFQQLRILALRLMGALPVIGVVLWAVLSATQDVWALPPPWLMLAQVAAGVSVHFFNEAAGRRTPPIVAGLPREEAETTSRLAFQSAMVERFAFSEAIAIVSLAAAFWLAEGGILGYVTGALVSLALMVLHVWPTPRAVERTAAALERDGGTSYLREALGLA
jgi:hypothetical protein